MKTIQIYLIFIILCYWTPAIGQINEIFIAHSHNDYEQEYPLTSALALGFRSIEIDILLYEDQLKVTHNRFNLSSKPTIEELYFDPLKGLSHKNISLKWILIDFKDYSIETLEQLHQAVSNYKDLFKSRTSTDNGNRFQVILSGNIPRSEIANNPKYDYFFLDGRISDLEQPGPIRYTPMISSNITTFTSWQRNHCLKEDEIKNIKSLVSKIHDRGIKLRFWNTDDNEIMWNQLFDLDIDVISVDDLDKFRKFTGQK